MGPTAPQVDEEYRPLKPDHVLPEFLLLYRLSPNAKRRAPPTRDAAKARRGDADDESTAAAALARVARRTDGLFKPPEAADPPPGPPPPATKAHPRHDAGPISDRTNDPRPLALASALLPNDDDRRRAAPKRPSPKRSPPRPTVPSTSDLDLAHDGDDPPADDLLVAKWEHVLHNALHEKRKIVAHIERLLSGRK